jgi:hypothetical protein
MGHIALGVTSELLIFYRSSAFLRAIRLIYFATQLKSAVSLVTALVPFMLLRN